MKVYQKIILILLGLLILPLTFIKSHALNEVPEWVYSGDYYVVYENIESGDLFASVITSKQGFIRVVTDARFGVYVPESSFIQNYRLKSGSDTWVIGNKDYFRDNETDVRYVQLYTLSARYRLKYSNFDIYVNDELVFQETPVMNLAMVQRKAVEDLEKEVQGASGRILAVGGVILGLVLVPLLVNRLIRWGVR